LLLKKVACNESIEVVVTMLNGMVIRGFYRNASSGWSFFFAMDRLLERRLNRPAYSMEVITHQLYYDRGRRGLEVKPPWKPKMA
jgi:hypothetical protein